MTWGATSVLLVISQSRASQTISLASTNNKILERETTFPLTKSLMRSLMKSLIRSLIRSLMGRSTRSLMKTLTRSMLT